MCQSYRGVTTLCSGANRTDLLSLAAVSPATGPRVPSSLPAFCPLPLTMYSRMLLAYRAGSLRSASLGT